MGIPHICQRLVFGAQCLENGLWDRSSLKRELLQKLPKSFDSITLLQENKQDWWFQLGVATAHTAKTATAFLQDFFGDCIVEHGLWPLRSPDHTPSDFCLWGFLTATTQETWRILSFRLNSCWPAMTNKLFEKFAKNTMKWVKVYLQEGGGHFSI